MFGFVASNWVFALARVIITIGEMITMPTSQALAANFAPEDMQGRYKAVLGLSWGIPAIIAPSAAGLIMDNYNPFLLWYVAPVSIVSFYFLHLWLGKRDRFKPLTPEEKPLPATL